MHSHHSKAIVDANGNIRLEKLPFSVGETVEVFIYSSHTSTSNGECYPLRDVKIQFSDATSPVAESDWESDT